MVHHALVTGHFCFYRVFGELPHALFHGLSVKLGPFVGKVTLLSPIVGEFANDDEVRPMNFVPPYAERLFELASSGKFPVPVNCEIYVGSEDWQSCPNSKAFGEMVGLKVNVVEGAGHSLPKAYVSDLLDQWKT